MLAFGAFFCLLCSFCVAGPMGNAFAYQGRLNDAGRAASGIYDFRFCLFDAVENGAQVGNAVTNNSVNVSNGLFTAMLDFGISPFSIGQNRWLQMEVRTNGAASFTFLGPRQLLTPNPYALYAQNAGGAALASRVVNGSITSSSLATGAVTGPAIAPGAITSVLLPANVAYLDANGQTFSGQNSFNTLVVNGTVTANTYAGNGSNLSNVNAATLGGLNSASFWQTQGNAGTTPGAHYLGTADNVPLELRVNGSRALRLEPQPQGEVQITAGYSSNQIVGVNTHGSLIAGGGQEPEIRYDPRTRISTTNYRHHVISAAFATIGGGAANQVRSDYSVIGGGQFNVIGTNVPGCVIAGGVLNLIATQSVYIAAQNTIGGGGGNKIETDASQSTIAGGVGNKIGAVSQNATIGGGNWNEIQASARYCTIAGGSNNKIGTNVNTGTIGGGELNSIGNNAQYVTIPGGSRNQAWGWTTFAAGRRALALHDGAFVWGDATDADIASTTSNSVTLRASGGYRLFSNTNGTMGASLAAGSGSWTSMSDRSAKEDIQPVNPRGVLDKVATLPVSTWKYKTQPNSIRHIGPMAQDFKAAFAVGETDTGITVVDADGVALAAIQGLNQKVEDRTQASELRTRRLESENAALKQELAELKAMVQAMAEKMNTGARAGNVHEPRP